MLIRINKFRFLKVLLAFLLCFCAVFACTAASFSAGAQAASGIYMTYYSAGAWRSFTDGKAEASDITGIRIQTPGKSYALIYKTWNSGKTDFYPEVRSDNSAADEYAGLEGSRIIMNVGIRVVDSSGNKVNSGIVVMYRSKIGDTWQPWVSNASPDWMRSVKLKYRIEGEINTSGANTSGGTTNLQNISGLEIKVFEEDSTVTQMQPSGNYRIIDVPHIYQKTNWPTGCESVSAVMALNYAGVDVSVDTFIDNYLDKGDRTSFDPNETFGGDPRSTSGMGCYVPVIKKACDRLLHDTRYYTETGEGVPLTELCSKYIDNGIPVILWATTEMASPYVSKVISYNGRNINWISPEHCLLLVGYDDYYYIFNDPQHTEYPVYYLKSDVERAYAGLYMQYLTVQGPEPAYCPDALPDFTPGEFSAPSPNPKAFYGSVNLFSGSFRFDCELTVLGKDNENKLALNYNSSKLAASPAGCGFSCDYLENLCVVNDSEIRLFVTPAEYITYKKSDTGIYLSDNPAAAGTQLCESQNGFVISNKKDGSFRRYDISGRLALISDRRGRVVRITYNDLTAVITDDTTLKSVSLLFDTDGYITQVTDGENQIAYFEYTNGYLTLLSISDTGEYRLFYNEKGILYKAVSLDGVTSFENTYDSSGRIISDGTAAFAYKENTVTVTDGEAEYYRGFDDSGNLILSSGAGETSMAYAYDENRNLISAVYGDKGDLNKDGSVNLCDLVRLKRLLAQNEDISSFISHCDINSDGSFDGTDLTLLMRFILGADRRYISVELYSYDTFGRIVSFTDVGGSTIHFSYGD